jgi:polyisoprenyl-phosphate glycosyltransferase
MKTINLIIPCHNEEEGLKHFYKELANVLATTSKYPFKIIFINDGSSDNTLSEIKQIQENNASQNIHYIDFSRNFGHQAAIEAGLNSSLDADAVIMLDADLQHPPSYIHEFIDKWEQGFKIVNTSRTETENVSFFKKKTSNLFYKLFNSLSEIELVSGSSDFRLLDKKVVEEINKLSEKNKFFRGLVSWIGFNTITVEYTANQRLYGKSSYTLKKMLRLAHSGITSFSVKPMKIILTLGIILMILSAFALSAMIITRYFISPTFFSGPAILAMFIILNNGLLISLIGIIANYQIIMHQELQNRPSYIIREEK